MRQTVLKTIKNHIFYKELIIKPCRFLKSTGFYIIDLYNGNLLKTVFLIYYQNRNGGKGGYDIYDFRKEKKKKK